MRPDSPRSVAYSGCLFFTSVISAHPHAHAPHGARERDQQIRLVLSVAVRLRIFTGWTLRSQLPRDNSPPHGSNSLLRTLASAQRHGENISCPKTVPMLYARLQPSLSSFPTPPQDRLQPDPPK